MGEFVHLHLHTEYSLLDGATRIRDIADKALSDGQDAVAITDHGVMYGAVEFYEALKAKGVKPIIGCEVYVAERGRLRKEGKQDSSGNHLILLCKNAEGYRNLSYMVSMSFIDGFYMKPRVDMELLSSHHEGLIALSGCLAGRIPRLILSGAMDEAEKYANEMKALFGEDFYLEIQNHSLDDERRVAYGIRILSERCGIPMVATNDVHYLERRDADMQATLLCIQTNNVITDGRPFGFETDEYYFRTASEMKALFSAFPGAVENTVKIAEKCNFDFTFNELYLPDFVPEDGLTHPEKLRADAMAGYAKLERAGRFSYDLHPKEEYLARMEYELSVIERMGFCAYYLIVADFVRYAKSHDIPVGPGRGSGAASLVAFCVGITDVDPIAFDLLFERFLNPERVSMPDFDIDFCYERREEVIEYVKRRYGEDHVAQIVTFGTLAARAAIRDVGRALGMPYAKVDPVAKLVPQKLDVTLDQALEVKELRDLYEADADVRRLIDISKSLEGMPRHASTHAAGVVITEKPTYEYVPLSSSGTGVVTQFDMNTDAKLGLVKFDFLGLRYLTVIHDAVRMIRKSIPDFDLETIPFDDRETYKLLSDARTDGVFQLESGGIKQVLTRLCPTALEDVIAVIALYRPGPMDSINTFIARKQGKEPIVYSIPQLASILDVTYGCIVYQEQVMQICRILAGYSFAHADLVRRAMAKKKASAMEAERTAFLEGCAKNGIAAADAERIFEEMSSFANYAFNKSHATAYGIISYRTAYLKAHHPAEYYAALMSSVLTDAQKLRSYIADAGKLGVRVLPPDVNESEEDFSVKNGAIRFGLMAIRNVGRPVAEAIVRERRNGSYRTFDGFLERMREADLNVKSLEYMIKCGVFDSLGHSRATLLSCYVVLLDSVHEKARNNVYGQMDLFSAATETQGSGGYRFTEMPEYELRDLLTYEKEASGMYFSGHMIDAFSEDLERRKPDRIGQIREDFALAGEAGEELSVKYRDGVEVNVAGMITAKKTKLVKNGDTMAFLTLEDDSGEIEVIVFAKSYGRFADLLREESAVWISGKLSAEDDDVPRLIFRSAEALIPNGNVAAKAETAKPQRLFVKLPTLSEEKLRPLYRIAMLNPGEAEVAVYAEDTKKYSAVKNLFLDPSDRVLERLSALYGEKNVVLR